MDDYRVPLEAIVAALRAVGVDEVLTLDPYQHFSAGDFEEVLAGLGGLAEKVIAPTDAIGDRNGCAIDPESRTVAVPEEIRDAFAAWVEGGWSGLTSSVDHGGGGLPSVVGAAAEEVLAAANMALSLNPMLTQGAVHLLEAWGTEAQRQRYLEPLVTGRWTGTMNLTEADAGSDVGAVRTTATQRADGSWGISGVKIFITWGEHDLAENIIHLVLARTKDAPPGSKGLSLFVVPRNRIAPDGSVGERNGVACLALERKLGIHASPTCVLEFDDATAELVGPLHGGMAAMFTMMNSARRSVALEGLGVAERATQQAARYAQERRQGRAVGRDTADPAPIVEHPDVRRMLALMVTGVDAMRLLLFRTAVLSDQAAHHPDDEIRARAARRVDLHTPIAKAWSTDEGVRIASLAIQVHGGAGFIEETGVAQRYRDARITPIYEGTNGIQAIDLVTRKVRRDGGAAMGELVEDTRAHLDAIAGEVAGRVDRGARRAVEDLECGTDWLLRSSDPEEYLAGATPYLDLAALVATCGLYARAVDASRIDGTVDAVTRSRYEFFVEHRVAACSGHLTAVTSGPVDRSLLLLR